jgi:hypothetical protein
MSEAYLTFKDGEQNIMAIQEIEIGIPISASDGEFHNTVFKDGKLQLVEITQDIINEPVYAQEGYWISENIRLIDKFKSFKNFVKTAIGNGNYKIYTQSSIDTYTWTDWKEINYENGNILSPMGAWARVKIEITANKIDSQIIVDKFNDISKFENDYVDNANSRLGLKKKYEFEMSKNYSNNENIYIKHVENIKFKKIDKIRIGVR